MINTMKHYYLINGKVMKGSEMPTKTYLNDAIYNEIYTQDYNDWLSSLQPCEISESELEKVEMHLTKNMSMYMDFSNPIDITDIIRIEDTSWSTKIYFKQPTEPKYVKCGDCNKFYTCTNCGEQCSIDGHFIEQSTEKQVESECEAVGGYVAFNVNGIISRIYSNLEWLKEDYPNSGYYKLTALRNI